MEGLYRSRDDRLVSGLCAALARRLRIGPFVLRFLFVVLTLASGVGLLLYLLGTLAVRQEDSAAERFWPVVRDNLYELRHDATAAWGTLVGWFEDGRAQWIDAAPEQRRRSLIAGAFVLGGATLFVWTLGLLWWLTWTRLLAIGVIAVGCALLRTLRG